MKQILIALLILFLLSGCTMTSVDDSGISGMGTAVQNDCEITWHCWGRQTQKFSGSSIYNLLEYLYQLGYSFKTQPDSLSVAVEIRNGDDIFAVSKFSPITVSANISGKEYICQLSEFETTELYKRVQAVADTLYIAKNGSVTSVHVSDCSELLDILYPTNVDFMLKTDRPESTLAYYIFYGLDNFFFEDPITDIISYQRFGVEGFSEFNISDIDAVTSLFQEVLL